MKHDDFEIMVKKSERLLKRVESDEPVPFNQLHELVGYTYIYGYTECATLRDQREEEMLKMIALLRHTAAPESAKAAAKLLAEYEFSDGEVEPW